MLQVLNYGTLNAGSNARSVLLNIKTIYFFNVTLDPDEKYEYSYEHKFAS